MRRFANRTFEHFRRLHRGLTCKKGKIQIRVGSAAIKKLPLALSIDRSTGNRVSLFTEKREEFGEDDDKIQVTCRGRICLSKRNDILSVNSASTLHDLAERNGIIPTTPSNVQDLYRGRLIVRFIKYYCFLLNHTIYFK